MDADQPRELMDLQRAINENSDYDRIDPGREDWSLGRVYVPMTTGKDNWLISSEVVRMVMIPSEIVLVPDAQPHVRGIVHSSGVIYTVIDLNRIKRMRGAGTEKDVQISVRSRLVCIERRDNPVALLVERARDVVSVNTKLIKPAVVAPNVATWFAGGDVNRSGGVDLVLRHDEFLKALDEFK